MTTSRTGQPKIKSRRAKTLKSSGGAQLLRRVDERLIRGFVVVLGLCLTLGLFLRGSR